LTKMNMQEIIDEWDKDCGIDKSQLDTEAADIPSLHNKYMKIWHEERVRWIGMNTSMRKFLVNKRRFYLGDMDRDELDTLGWEYDGSLKAIKSNVDKYIERDDEVIERQQTMEFQEQKNKFIEGILKSINNRSYAIGHAIAFQKFTHQGLE